MSVNVLDEDDPVKEDDSIDGDDVNGGDNIPANSIGSKLRFGLADEYNNPVDVDCPVTFSNLSIAELDNNLSMGDECLKSNTIGCRCTSSLALLLSLSLLLSDDTFSLCKEDESREATPLFDEEDGVLLDDRLTIPLLLSTIPTIRPCKYFRLVNDDIGISNTRLCL